ncbi:DUF7687 domain-containing protein [Xanthomonas cucurbitae]|uniref:Uncharacterized protein n=2 Tax=Xanthomonas cucurbitae TaxID=56453 RepID=A0ABY7YCA6_9XANT|nr:hypothetical protein [Xanthomonas cucurbitae]WDM71437.1 hypothetical protein K6978_19235 [Xanthomonas cucurbitae]
MRGNPEFMRQPQAFWALVRTLSEQLGYTNRVARGALKGSGTVKIHRVEQMATALTDLRLSPALVLRNGCATELGETLHRYFAYRADVLNNTVRPNLMNAADASALYWEVNARVNPLRFVPLPMNKQKGAMAAPAFLTGLVNMLVHEVIGDVACDYDPRQLTTFTRNGIPLRTLARRVDGAFPSTVNPIAVWEIKEYYYTTTFGSRVADGVYETLLDGLELDDLEKNEGVRADHILIVDSHYTWWVCGKSYLCRIIDMLNMGLVSEVIFGREVVERIPALAREWLNAARSS